MGETDELLATITRSTPTMSRSCARCDRPLTDAASLEAGIGPICRRRNNALLARQLPLDLAAARGILEDRRRFLRGVHPEVAPVLSAIVDAVRFDREREDWRVTVKRMEWLLSTEHATGMLREVFYELTEALGYVALVSLWKRELAIGSRRPTRLSFDDGRLILESVRPPAAVVERLRGVAGRRFDGDRKAWTFPAQRHAQVGRLIRRHFLSPQGVEAALEAARAHHEATTTASGGEARPAFTFESLEGEGGAVAIHSPYDAAFVAELKAVIRPISHRRWDRARRAWIVEGAAQIAQARALARRYFE